MPIWSPLNKSDSSLALVPFGTGGLDEFTDEYALTLGRLRRADNVRTATGALERRKGAKKLWQFTDPGASKTFGTDAKYASIPAGTHLETLDGGFALTLHITAERAGVGNTAMILSSRVSGQSYHVLRVQIDENGLLYVGFEKRSGGDCVVTTSALTASAAVDVLAIFDPVGGTFTVYVDGVSSGTPVTGLTAADGPVAGAGTAWHLGVHYNPVGATVVANTFFGGAIQGVTLLSLRGIRAASGTTTLVDTLIRHSARMWPAPQAPSCLMNFDCADTSTTTLYDSSRYKNDATMTGTPSNTSSISTRSIPSNFVGYLELPNSRGVNVIASHGRLYYETIVPAL